MEKRRLVAFYGASEISVLAGMLDHCWCVKAVVLRGYLMERLRWGILDSNVARYTGDPSDKLYVGIYALMPDMFRMMDKAFRACGLLPKRVEVDGVRCLLYVKRAIKARVAKKAS